ncbi:flagellar export chaperone FliS [Paenibacillus pinistramenti]|uniref:flagellar export chaperone FliS n=1 Tax=Paenibacillus pinistramenti TaxID=1768003 RepID=UPI001107F748|nr:flagellar export chaperone FliS [Paenibacillus pinistramenti]
MQNPALLKYQQTSIQTATPAQLLIMLYDGAIRFINQGIEGIENKRYDQANLFLCKAQAVIHELTASLDFKYPLANSLSQIYEYMIYKLMQGNIKKEVPFCREVVEHLKELREAWKEAIKLADSSSTAKEINQHA